jgi:hypothetical protein
VQTLGQRTVTQVGAAGNDNARRFPPSVGIDHPEPSGCISFQDKLPFWWGPSLLFHVPPVLRRNFGGIVQWTGRSASKGN